MAKLGLVLSGGGAKGAYHVGVIKALQELNLKVDMLSGASIGALNGAVLLSAENQELGLAHLEQLWNKLPEVKPIQFNGISEHLGFKKSVNASTYISLLLASGLRLATPIGIPAMLLALAYDRLDIKNLEGVCKQEPLSQMMDEFLNLDALNKSIPFYVSTYKMEDHEKAITRLKETLKATTNFLKAEILGIDNQFSEFYKIQDLTENEQKGYILASAALPLIFLPQKDNDGHRFIDGGLGGAVKSQGNTPITPLIEAGCTHIIVSHLDHGSLWHRHDYPDVNILEIRPSQSLDLSLSKLLDFSKENIDLLRSQGYLDTKQELNRVIQSLSNFYALQDRRASLKTDLAVLKESGNQLAEVMKKL